MTSRVARPPVVLLGLDCITGLQSARILARHEVPVVGVAGDLRHFAARTRVCREIRRADLTSAGLVDALLAWRHELAGAVLLPCTDLTVSLVSDAQHRLAEHYLFALPDHSVTRLLMDKSAFAAYADGAALAVPRSIVLDDRHGAERAAAELSYPVVVKPPLKSPTWTRHTKERAFVVDSPAELLATYDRVHTWAPTLVGQEWVPGDETALYSCNAYFDSTSQPLVTFVARKLRQWPPVTGTSAAGEECRNDEVLTQTVKLFTGLGYRGLAYLEMKRDPRSGRHYVIEPNVGRPTGRSAIAEGAGVELLYTMYCDLVGLPLPDARTQRYGRTVWVDIRRDAQAALHAWRAGTLRPGAWWRSLRGHRAHAVWAPRQDPAPFWYDLAQSAQKLLPRWVTRGRATPPGDGTS